MIWFGFLAILMALLSFFIFFPRFRIAFLVVILVFSFASVTEILGVSKPSRLEWRRPDKVAIISYYFVEGKYIYLWVMMNGRPAAYAFPWNIKMAQRIQRAFRRAKNTGNRGVLAKNLFGEHKGDKHNDMKPRFIPVPRNSMPRKTPKPIGYIND